MLNPSLLRGRLAVALTMIVVFVSTVAGATDTPTAAEPKPAKTSHRAGWVGPEDLAKRIANGQAPHILDVRRRDEFAAGHIPGATNVPASELAKRLGSLGWAADSEIVVHGERGRRAKQAAELLHGAGFGRILLLGGHMYRWRLSDLPLEVPAAEGAADEAEPAAGDDDP